MNMEGPQIETHDSGPEAFAAAMEHLKGEESALRSRFENTARAAALVAALGGLSACAPSFEMHGSVSFRSGNVPLNYPSAEQKIYQHGGSYISPTWTLRGGSQGVTIREFHSENKSEENANLKLAQTEMPDGKMMTIGASVVGADGVVHTFEVPFEMQEQPEVA